METSSDFCIWNLERTYTPEKNLNNINKILKDLSLSVYSRVNQNKLFVTYVALLDGKGEEISSGAGKGQYSYIGALAEALEHYTHEQDCFSSSMKIMRSKEIISQSSLINEGFLKLLDDSNDSLVRVKPFTSIETGSIIFLPMKLVNPHYQKKDNENDIVFNRLCRYSSNSGAAFGIDRFEALLHGVNEIIERHILSNFYLDILGFDSEINFYSISKFLLSAELSQMLSWLEKKYKASTKVLVTQTKFNTWCAIAILYSELGTIIIPQVGSGSSYFLGLSIRRAISELNQICILYGDEERDEDERSLAFAKQFPNLKNVIYLTQSCLNYPSLKKIPEENITLLPKEQFNIIVNSMGSQGYALYYSILANFKNLGYVTQVYAPGLERFHLIRAGNPVAPQAVLKNNGFTEALG